MRSAMGKERSLRVGEHDPKVGGRSALVGERTAKVARRFAKVSDRLIYVGERSADVGGCSPDVGEVSAKVAGCFPKVNERSAKVGGHFIYVGETFPDLLMRTSEFRDRYLDDMNIGRCLLEAWGKYDVSRQLPAASAAPEPLALLNAA